MQGSEWPWKKWKLSPDSDPQERFIVVTEDGEREVCGVIENEADADLLAAAPDLLMACQAIAEFWEMAEDEDGMTTALSPDALIGGHYGDEPIPIYDLLKIILTKANAR